MARYVIQKGIAWTFCDEAHPVRLGRNPQHHHGESISRALAIDLGKKGYLCEGDEHPYDLWVVYNEDDDRESNIDAFDNYRDAKACADEMNARVAAGIAT